jgi:hypothetical protein
LKLRTKMGFISIIIRHGLWLSFLLS